MFCNKIKYIQKYVKLYVHIKSNLIRYFFLEKIESIRTKSK